ncbi:MAG: hypothetical protein Q4G59_07955 [Planctomycetia bacterium]|nr:hypothetical protein [Planctomycetia bacterium]
MKTTKLYHVVVLLCLTLFFVLGGKNESSVANESKPDKPAVQKKSAPATILNSQRFHDYIEEFNRNDDEFFKQYYPNDAAWSFLSANIPFFDYPDKDIERAYYFRWWVFRKHIRLTAEKKFVITEFLPNVSWAGKENTISCAAGHHIREGRWLWDRQVMEDYMYFWLRGGGAVRSYSFWVAEAVRQYALASGNTELGRELLDDLVANYEAWEKSRLDPNGLFWQIDDRDGMEISIGGSGYRVTINTYMQMDAAAIAVFAKLAERSDLAKRFQDKADTIRKQINEKLWDPKAQFFKVAPRVWDKSDALVLQPPREEHGYTPWYADPVIPPPEYNAAWKQLLDPDGFFAPFGPTTLEQRNPQYIRLYGYHKRPINPTKNPEEFDLTKTNPSLLKKACQSNGMSWPFGTTVTLTGLANLINREVAAGRDTAELLNAYRTTLKIYAHSQYRKTKDGRTVSWIDENLNPYTGDWVSRTIREKSGWKVGGGYERGKDYNHSTFCDLVINGLIGIRPALGPYVDVFPLVDRNIKYFTLDRVPYHGKSLTIQYDKTGTVYNNGKGLRIMVDGKEIHRCDTLPEKPLHLRLP